MSKPSGPTAPAPTPVPPRLTIGAWSWAGVAGLLATFDTDLAEVVPPELVAACRRLVRRWQAVAGNRT
ncbi:hypothetical protein [Nocardia sp. NPDC002869]|uniref:hypothetical protein n=1 Tax=Nocardia sp. NPDC002869 TaxID=3161032 RepID=UPI00398CEA8C